MKTMNVRNRPCAVSANADQALENRPRYKLKPVSANIYQANSLKANERLVNC
jgi:hypothetical protein